MVIVAALEKFKTSLTDIISVESILVPEKKRNEDHKNKVLCMVSDRIKRLSRKPGCQSCGWHGANPIYTVLY